MNAEDVVREVAKMDPITQDGDEWSVCFFCGNSFEYWGDEARKNPAYHKETCLWRVCRQKVAEEEEVAREVKALDTRLRETAREGSGDQHGDA